MNRILYPIFIILCLFVTPNLFAQDDTECAPFLEQPDFTGDPACGFFDGAGRWINLCSPCGNKIADDDCVNAPTPSICELDGFSSTSSGFTIDLGPEGIGWCSNGAPFTVFNNNMWIGFTASTNIIDLFIDVECPAGSLGFQLGIVSAPNCTSVVPIVCLNGGGGGVGVTNDQTLRTENLIPGQPYFIVIDGFAGGVCDFTINVTDGFVEPGFETAAADPSTLCVDVLNEPDFLPISPSASSGAIVDVTVDITSGATTDLLFFWNDPNGDLITETGPSDIFGNIVRGTLDGTFFTEPGIYSVQIVDLGSCCPICAEVELEVGMPPPAAAAAVQASTVTGVAELNCFNESLLIQGGPDDGAIPLAEAWTIENAAGSREQLASVLVSAQGRMDEIIIDREIIEQNFPNQVQGVARVLYGFTLSFEQACFGEAFVEIPFDFREPDIDIEDPAELDCALNPFVVLDASGTDIADNHNATYMWEASDGVSSVAGADTDMPTVTNSGFYRVTVTDTENGCMSVDSIEVTGMVDPPVLGMIEDITLNCNTTSMDVATTGTANDPINFSWDGPGGDLGVSVPELTDVTVAGTYTLTATNSVNQCIASTSFNVTVEMPTIAVSEVRDSTLSCTVAELTFAGAIPSGGMGPYTYSWSLNGTEVSTDSVLVADAEGDYILTVTDTGTGCTGEQTTVVNMNMESPIIGMLPDTLVIDCNNNMVSAIADATDVGGGSIAGVLYEWTQMGGTFSENTPDVNFDAEGTYTVEVTNPANGCVSQASIEVIEDLEDPDASIMMPDDLTCMSPTTMLQGASTTGGSLSYQWFAGDPMTGTALGTSIDQEVMATGTYTLIITNDENGCTMEATTTVGENMMDPTPDAGMPQVLTCLNEVDGVMLDGSASSGMGTLSYEWTLPGGAGSAGSTAMINGTVEGTYTLVITDDANGCTAMSTVMVTTDMDAPENVSVNDGVLQCGDTDFELTAVTSTTGNLSYSWTDQGMNVNFPTTATIPVTSAGVYTVTITNLDNGCSTQASGTVMTDQDTPDVTPTLVSGSLNINCDNPLLTYDGVLTTPNPDVTVQWFDPNGDPIPGGSILMLDENSIPGQYMVVATNSVNGCTAPGAITPIFDFTRPDVELNAETILCAPNDEVVLMATELGSLNTTYSWTDMDGNPLPGQSPSVSIAGMYTVVATNVTTGCDTTLQILVEEDAEEPTIAVAPAFELTCMPGGDSYALGGSELNGDPVTFSWVLNGMEISTDPNFEVSAPGLYELTVTNMLTGCTSTESVNVTEGRTMPIAIAQVQTRLNCVTDMVMLEGSSDDMLTSDYVWTSELGTVVMGQNPMVSEPGVWELVVTSANGCTAMDMTLVEADFDAPENVMITGDDELTCTVNNIQLFGSTSTMGVTYAWSINQDLDNVVSVEQNPNFGAPGTYTLVVTASNGCTDFAEFVISSDDQLPTAMADVDRAITCTNETTMIFGTSSAANTEFSWSGPIGFPGATTQDIETSIPGEYTLTILDMDNMCDAMFTVTVFDEREDPDVMTQGGEVVCDPNVVTTVSATTDVDNATYLWEGPNGFTSMESNPVITEAGPYSVTVTNPANGCFTVAQANGGEGRDLPEGLQSGADVELLTCNEPISTLSASSTTTGVIFTWNGPGVVDEESSAITVEEPGTYMVNFLDPSNGCNTTDLVVVAIDTTAPMVVGATPDQLNCQITDVELNVQVNEDVTYAWDGPAAVSDPTAANPTASMTGLYSVTVTAVDNGCTNVETIFVDVDTNMPVSVSSGSEITCEFPTVDLLGTGSTESAMGNISYEWTNSNGDVISTDLNTTTSVADDYTLTVFDSDNLCEISSSVTIGEDIQEPIADAGPDDVFACSDAFVTLSAALSSGQGTLSYEWTNSNGTVIGDEETIDVIESGVFTVLVTDSDNGCTSTALVTITPDADKPNIDIAMPETITCAVTSVELNASNTTGVGTLTYMWTLESNPTVVLGTDAILSVTTSGVYTLMVMDGSNGCTETSSIPVNIDVMEPTFDSQGGEIDCTSGETDVTLSNIVATNPTFNWTGPVGFPGATTQNLMGVTIPGTYNVTVTDGDNGCPATGSVEVTENSLTPTADIGPAEMLDCDTEVIQLNGMADGTNLSFSWTGPTPNAIISGPNTLTPTVGTAGEYTLTVTDPSNGCATVRTITVEENENMPTAFSPEVNDANCFGPNTGSISLNASQVTGGQGPFMYSIDGGDSFTQQEDFLGLTAGTYDVVVMDINGCTFNVTVEVNPAEDLVLDYGENLVIAFGDSIDLIPELINFDIVEAVWNDSTLTGGMPNVRPTSTTTFEIDAQDINGCPISDQITIFVEKTRPVYIPSAFSPNGDGTNDVFTVFADLDLITSIRSLSVYDRWGEQMFFKDEMTPAEALQPTNGWDGNFRGEEMNPGVYVYHVLVEFIDGEEIFFEGDVTIVK